MSYTNIKYEKTCLECGESISGRKDKKFCSLACKNDYNNKKNLALSRYRHGIMSQISKNYKLLETLVSEQITTIPISELETQGFDANCITGCSLGKAHTEYHCFDIIYRKTSKKIFALHRKATIF